MKSNSNRNLLVGFGKKAMPFAACAFFLCLTSTHAQNNEASNSDVYGSNLDRAAIDTFTAGETDLDIYNPLTTSLTLRHDVSGYVNISNGFSSFSISTTDGSLTSSNAPSLSVFGGTNLTISGGSFGGSIETLASNEWTGANGGWFSNVANVVIEDASFIGQTIDNEEIDSGGGPPIPGQTTTGNASGSAGLMLEGGTFADISGTTISGGHAGTATEYQTNTFAIGGSGLAMSSSSVVLSNVTVTGGNAGEATSFGEFTAFSFGGDAIAASNSTLTIHSGTFTPGTGGTANGIETSGGAALYAYGGSSVTNHGGTFNGTGDLPAVIIEDSDLTTFGGTYGGAGLLSLTTGTETNQIDLLGGTFNELSFINLSNGVQQVSVSNISIFSEASFIGGTTEVENYDESSLQSVVILDADVTFKQDFSLTGNLFLFSTNSSANFTTLSVANGASVNAGTGSITASGDISLASGSTLNLAVLTNGAGNITAPNVTFETNSTLSVDASLAGFSSGVQTTEVITASITGFDTNAMNAEIIVSVNTNVDSRTSADFSQTGSGLAIIFSTASFADFWGATNGQFGALAVELEALATPEMNIIINNLGSEKSAALVEETYFTTMNTFQVAKQGLDAAVGLALSRGTEFRDQILLPKDKGPLGPSLNPQNDWRFWMKYYGNFYSRGEDGLNPEYDAIMHGGVLGMDKSFGKLLVGLAGGAGRYSIDTDSNAEQNMNAFQGALYSTVGFGHSYIDAGLAYGYNDVESTTADPFSLKGEFDTHLLSAHLGGGFGFDLEKIGTVLTPEASIRYTAYEQDGYTETGANAVPRTFDSFDSDSLVGTLGLNAAMMNENALEHFAFKIEGRAHWMREFNPEPGELNYQLVGGVNDYTIIYPFLDEDTIRLGVGFTFFNTKERALKNVLLRLDFDELFGEDFNSHNLSAKVIYAF